MNLKPCSPDLLDPFVRCVAAIPLRPAKPAAALRPTDTDVRDIRWYYRLGYDSYDSLAHRFGLSAYTIGRIIRREIWTTTK